MRIGRFPSVRDGVAPWWLKNETTVHHCPLADIGDTTPHARRVNMRTADTRTILTTFWTISTGKGRTKLILKRERGFQKPNTDGLLLKTTQGEKRHSNSSEKADFLHFNLSFFSSVHLREMKSFFWLTRRCFIS